MLPPFLKRLLIFVAVTGVTVGGAFLYLRWHAQEEMVQKPADPKKKMEVYNVMRAGHNVQTTESILQRMSDEYTYIVSLVSHSIVSINTAGVSIVENPSTVLSDDRMAVYGLGSGVIVSKEGHIVTNYHVICDKQVIRATLNDGRSVPIYKIGEDPQLDLAVLKIDSKEQFRPIHLGDSASVKVGQMVLALGNPFGIGMSVTHGIVSGRDRSMRGITGVDLIQTDSPIYEGNSGGPLVNLRGEMIGLNSAIVSPNSSNGQLSSQKIAIGFSLPSNIVYQVFKQICDHGRPMRAYLGIDLMENTIPLREHLNFRDTTGSIVNEVFPDSPADRAGVRTGDVITEYNGRRVKNTIDLIRNIESLQVGDTVKLTIWRNGAKQFVRLLLDRTEQGVVPPGIFQKTTGIRLRNLTMKQRLNGFRGVIVDTVPESLKSALRVGDIIHAVDYETIESVNEVDNIFRNNGIDVLNISRRNIRFNVSLKKEGSLTQPKETETSVKETEEEQENKSN